MTDQTIKQAVRNHASVAEMVSADIRLKQNAGLLLKVCKLALLEFERISYQKRADPEVIKAIRTAVARAEGTEV